MTETKTVCDRCGKEIKGFSRIKIWKVRKKTLGLCFTFGPGDHDYLDEKLELCTNCYHDFEKWLMEKGRTSHASTY